MAHKEKVCSTALATHVEQCFQEFTYTPLIINRDIRWQLEPNVPVGLQKVVNHEIETEIGKDAKKRAAAPVDTDVLASEAFEAVSARLAKSAIGKLNLGDHVREAIKANIVAEVNKRDFIQAEDTRNNFVASAGAAFNMQYPDRALLARMDQTISNAKFDGLLETQFKPLPKLMAREFSQLGLFFTEATCFRCEGLTYTPCGHESTILPHEKFDETRTLDSTTIATDAESEESTTDVTQTDKNNTETTLVDSYDKTVKSTIDVKKESKINLKGKLFKVIDADVSSTGTNSFNHFIEKVNKSSSTIKRELVHEVVQKFTLNHKSSRSLSTTVTEKASWARSIENPTDKPLHFIEREAHCVYSVIHKRTNAHLAWSGCLDNPGGALCTPDNLEEKHSAQIQAIKDKWSKISAPASFGPRPANVRICTPEASQDGWGFPGNDNVTFTASVQALIPVGHGYVDGSASVTIIDSDTDVTSTAITSQPGAGGSGTVQFGVEILVNNKLANKEWVRFQICFDATPPEVAAYDAKVDQWRKDQAQAEIDALLAEELKHLDDFLLSDRVATLIEKQIFEKYFGTASTADCCALIARIRSIFDFSLLSYTLLPNWNEFGAGCQTTDPVTIYTAKCLNFYLPIKPGKEWEALAILISINVIPANAPLLAQIAGYISSVAQLRDTVFNRLFDPSGWEDEIDGPHGYDLTAYNTDNTTEWNASFESSLNYQLIDVNVVTVPCGGLRKELRPNLC